VLGMEHKTVTLDEGVNFWIWAYGAHPAPRWSVHLDPWQDGASFIRP
jgi:hypothetical protein